MMSNNISFKDSMCVMSFMFEFQVYRYKAAQWKLKELTQAARNDSKNIEGKRSSKDKGHAKMNMPVD